MTLSEHYDVALVLHDLVDKFDDAARALHQIRASYPAPQLLHIDVLFEPPTLLMCLLHFDPRNPGAEVLTELEEIARAGFFRILRVNRLDPVEQERFYNVHLARFSTRELDVGDLDPVLAKVRELMNAAPPPTPVARIDPDLKQLHFADHDAFQAAYRETEAGHTIALEDPLATTGPEKISLTVGMTVGPIYLSVEPLAGAEAVELGLEPRCRLLLPRDELDLFESFLIAVTRHTPWPERSGRRYERFPLGLRVEYRAGDEQRREVTLNVSRGGFALDTFEPPAVGEVFEFDLQAPGCSTPTSMKGRVAWSIDADHATELGVRCGAGIEFVDAPEVVRSQVEALLKSAQAAPLRRALIADDDRFFRTVLGNVLRLAGYEVLERENGLEACLCLIDELLRLDVLVTDLYMPGLGGHELLDKIRRIGGEEDLAVVVVTGADLDETTRIGLLSKGADAVFPKNTNFERVLDRIEQLLEEKSHTRLDITVVEEES